MMDATTALKGVELLSMYLAWWLSGELVLHGNSRKSERNIPSHCWIGRILLTSGEKATGYRRVVEQLLLFDVELESFILLTPLLSRKNISRTGGGPTNADELHRRLLDDMIDPPGSPWVQLGTLWNDEERQNITRFWHNIDGWPDSSQGLAELEKQFNIVSLSNANIRLQVDMAKYADFQWVALFSAEQFDTYKLNPTAYLSVGKLLNVPPHKCLMVAAHIYDLCVAKKCSFKTV
ncbi:hypothetical protein AX15_001058 [Amanita polypyramis BW_CC]|nr:hypothetical protein AX15_001058 [Amanita polypyramis BW_CC]